VRVAFDSNILLYLALVPRVAEDRPKAEKVETLLLDFSEIVTRVVPFQVLGECYQVMLRTGYTREKCQAVVREWMYGFEAVASSDTAFANALDLATDHKLQFWDALILSVAVEAGCALLLSEDLQPGFTWRGVTVVNPLAETLDERLVRILDAPK
jgi:predicted nucleic acid-binding protein